MCLHICSIRRRPSQALFGESWCHSIVRWVQNLAGSRRTSVQAHNSILCEEVLSKRFGRYGLTVHPQKTKLVRFRKPRKDDDDRKNGTFDYLGFTHYWAKSRRGYWVIKRKTMKKRWRRAVKAVWIWCRNNRHEPLEEQYKKLCQKLRGHFQYYAIRGNYRMLEKVREYARKAWRYWLHRRSRKRRMTWERFAELEEVFPLPKPRILHQI